MERVISSDLIPQLFSVKERVVLVTGAGGMGKVIAKAFAHNGARVAVASRRTESLAELQRQMAAEQLPVATYQLDVSDKAQVEDVVKRVAADFGRIDVLVHTVGIAPLGPSLDFDEAALRQTLDVNFHGCVFMNAAVGCVMAESGWGRIININSIDAFAVNCVDDLPYSASKAAMLAATRHFAVDLAPRGVTVNGIAPVWIWTPMMDQRPADYMVQAAATIPLGRVSYTEDYLGMIFFLASEASSYVTGQTFLVDGGWAANRAFSYAAD